MKVLLQNSTQEILRNTELMLKYMVAILQKTSIVITNKTKCKPKYFCGSVFSSVFCQGRASVPFFTPL
jgi:hypothetical protein